MPWDDLDLPMPKTLMEQLAWSPADMLQDLTATHTLVLVWGCLPCLPPVILDWLQKSEVYCLSTPGLHERRVGFPTWTADVGAPVWWDTPIAQEKFCRLTSRINTFVLTVKCPCVVLHRGDWFHISCRGAQDVVSTYPIFIKKEK